MMFGGNPNQKRLDQNQKTFDANIKLFSQSVGWGHRRQSFYFAARCHALIRDTSSFDPKAGNEMLRRWNKAVEQAKRPVLREDPPYPVRKPVATSPKKGSAAKPQAAAKPRVDREAFNALVGLGYSGKEASLYATDTEGETVEERVTCALRRAAQM